jgi:hypothetical protein
MTRSLERQWSNICWAHESGRVNEAAGRKTDESMVHCEPRRLQSNNGSGFVTYSLSLSEFRRIIAGRIGTERDEDHRGSSVDGSGRRGCLEEIELEHRYHQSYSCHNDGTGTSARPVSRRLRSEPYVLLNCLRLHGASAFSSSTPSSYLFVFCHAGNCRK